MTVNSLFFLLFLAGVFFMYYVLCPLRFRWIVLLAASILFYALASAASPIYMLVTSVSIWGAGILMERLSEKEKRRKAEKTADPAFLKKNRRMQRWLLAAAAVPSIGILLALKYSGFFVGLFRPLAGLFGISLSVPKILAPLGISFYTLIAYGYLLDVYKSRVHAQKNFAKLLLFLVYFPQMTQGPMNRYKPMSEQLYEGHRFEYRNFSYGFQRMLWGCFKKFVIADRFHPVVQKIFANYQQSSSWVCILGCIYMTVWMYADFSGYMDIVAGASELFGIHIMENFCQPFFSKSLAEFWRRWHISLSSWFRDFVFYPLALSRPATKFGKKGRKWFGVRIGKLFPSLFALFFVWFATGFWHEPSWRYILWGVANGVIIMGAMILEPVFKRGKKFFHIREDSWYWNAFSAARTFAIVCLLKVFPGPASTMDSLKFIGKLFTDFRRPVWLGELLPGITKGDAVFLFCALLLWMIVDLIQEKQSVRDLLARQNIVVRWAIYLLLVTVILCKGLFNTSMAGGFAYAQY